MAMRGAGGVVRSAAVCGCIAAATAQAQEGLIVGQALGGTTTVKVFLDGQWQDLFTPAFGAVWGLAADATTETIYFSSSDQLYAWDAEDGQRLVGTIFDPPSRTALVMVGLGVDPSGQLFATRDIGGVFPQGLLCDRQDHRRRHARRRLAAV